MTITSTFLSACLAPPRVPLSTTHLRYTRRMRIIQRCSAVA
jgi:hypothetical protein